MPRTILGFPSKQSNIRVPQNKTIPEYHTLLGERGGQPRWAEGRDLAGLCISDPTHYSFTLLPIVGYFAKFDKKMNDFKK